MKRMFVMVVLVLALGGFASADAALIDRGGGMVYDTDLNITWYNYVNPNVNWNQATAWTQSLSVGGYADWRLPSALNPDGSGPSGPGYNITGSEFGHLYYVELGNVAHTSGYPGDGVQNVGLLTSFAPYVWMNYWTKTEYPNPPPGAAWHFYFGGGLQGISGMQLSQYHMAVAVRDGDVTPTPVPAAVWFLGAGLVGLAGLRRRMAGT